MVTRFRVSGLRPAITIASAACIVLLSACGANTPATTPSTSAPATQAASAGAPADAATLTLATADSSLGSILVDGKGMTLYLFTKDAPNASNCTGECLAAWPALLGKPTAGTGVDAAKLGSFTRADGSTQASYNGHPLYYFRPDTKAGDVKGQDVKEVWYVLDRDGNAVEKQAAATGSGGGY